MAITYGAIHHFSPRLSGPSADGSLTYDAIRAPESLRGSYFILLLLSFYDRAALQVQSRGRLFQVVVVIRHLFAATSQGEEPRAPAAVRDPLLLL